MSILQGVSGPILYWVLEFQRGFFSVVILLYLSEIDVKGKLVSIPHRSEWQGNNDGKIVSRRHLHVPKCFGSLVVGN